MQRSQVPQDLQYPVHRHLRFGFIQHLQCGRCDGVPHRVRGFNGARPRDGQAAHQPEHGAGCRTRVQAVQSGCHWSLLSTCLPFAWDDGNKEDSIRRIHGRSRAANFQNTCSAPGALHHGEANPVNQLPSSDVELMTPHMCPILCI